MAAELWDFGSESQQLTAAQLPFDKYVFLNAGVRGPFLPAYWPRSRSWTRVYLDKLSPSVKLVGNSVVCLPQSDPCVKGAQGITPNPDCYGPKVEGYAWATDNVGLQVLLDTESVFQSHPDKVSAIINGEYGMNIAIFKAGYTIDSLLLAYQGMDWTNRSNWGCNDNEHPSRSGTYFGVTQHPLETVFVKVEWVHDDGTIDKILPQYVDAYTNFQELGAARSSALPKGSVTSTSSGGSACAMLFQTAVARPPSSAWAIVAFSSLFASSRHASTPSRRVTVSACRRRACAYASMRPCSRASTTRAC